MPRRSLAIVGAGAVGATIAYACSIRGVAERIALYDIDKAKVEAEMLDLNHGIQFTHPAIIDGSDDIEVLRDAAVVVITAGAKQKPGQTRLELAGANARICQHLLPEILKVAPEAVIMVVTNPVDVLTYVCLKTSGLPVHRVFGSGTTLDSSRFRFLIARHLNVAVTNVHAYVCGEHGDSEVPLWSSASIGAIPLRDYRRIGEPLLTEQDKRQVFNNVRDAAQQIIAGKGATNYAIGLAAASILEAVLSDQNRVLPVSTLLTDYRGISDVCLSVPCMVNAKGMEQPLDVPMDAAELEGLRRSADVIRSVIREVGF